MTTHRSSADRFSRHVSFALALAGALALGCEEPEQIRTYETPAVGPRAEAIDPDEVRRLYDHMFAAVVPAEGQAWFFKLVVPATAADAVRKPFDDFLATVDVSDVKPHGAAVGDVPAAPVPAWTLPAGWTEAPGGNEMRAATITIPHDGQQFHITVSSLALRGEWPAFLKVNVDRWMDQLQQSPLDAATIAKLGRKLPTKKGDATAFELTGIMQDAPMGSMAGAELPAGHPAVETPAPANQDAAPPTASGPQQLPAADELAYTLPAGWEIGPPNSMRKATFGISQPDGQGIVTITAFPPVNQMSDPVANAVRWSADVGPRLTEEQAGKIPTDIKIDGTAGHRFAMNSPEGASPQRGLLAAMVVRDEQVWFFKFLGDRALVDAQREAFDQFLASIRFK